MVRVIRYATRTEFTIKGPTYQAFQNHQGEKKKCFPSRIRDKFLSDLKEPLEIKTLLQKRTETPYYLSSGLWINWSRWIGLSLNQLSLLSFVPSSEGYRSWTPITRRKKTNYLFWPVYPIGHWPNPYPIFHPKGNQRDRFPYLIIPPNFEENDSTMTYP